MNKKLSILLLFLMCFSTISSASAVSSNTILNDDTITDDDVDGDVLDIDTLSQASSSAYEDTVFLNMPVSNVPLSMNNFADLITFFEANGMSATAAHVDKGQLKPGDIVKVKNSDNAFLIYTGTDSNGNIQLEDIYYSYECSPQSFDLLFTGDALLINHATTEMTAINAESIDDKPIHDSSISIGPMCVAQSTYAKQKSSYTSSSSLIKSIANTILDGESTKLTKVQKQSLRAHKIWSWMSGQNYDSKNTLGRHMYYHYHLNTQHYLKNTLDNQKGNCAEQARIIVCVAQALNLTARYVHNSPGNDGHYWAQIKVDDTWINLDNTKCYKYGYGEHDKFVNAIYGGSSIVS